MRIHAVIPARGGSKGISEKNLRPVGGIPLLVRCIQTVAGVGGLDRVFVSTDSVAIKEVALAAGAEVIDRPGMLSTDTASSESALLHALDEMDRMGDTPDILLFLQCTSPFTRAQELETAVAMVRDGEADVAFAAAPFHGFIWKRDDAGEVLGINHHPSVRLRRQDREQEWVETGAFYAMRTEGFRGAEHRFFGRKRIVEVAPERAIDIDTPFDLVMANFFVQKGS